MDGLTSSDCDEDVTPKDSALGRHLRDLGIADEPTSTETSVPAAKMFYPDVIVSDDFVCDQKTSLSDHSEPRSSSQDGRLRSALADSCQFLVDLKSSAEIWKKRVGLAVSDRVLEWSVKIFGFSEQLKTYLSRVHFHLFDKMVGCGFESVLTEEDEHFLRNYWEVERDKQMKLNNEMKRNGFMHPTMLRLGVVLWASLSYLFHQYVFTNSKSESLWIPAVFIACFVLLLTPELITMWQHRLAYSRAESAISAFSSYLKRLEELAGLTERGLKLAQEFEFVEGGFVFNPASSTVTRRASDQLLILKASIFASARHLFHSHRTATRDLMMALPMGEDLDAPALYVAHIPVDEYGESLTLPFLPGNEEHLTRLRAATDDFASAALKAMKQLAHLQASEFVRRLILSASPQAFDKNSPELVTSIISSFCHKVITDLIPTILSLRRSYDFHRCQFLARERASTDQSPIVAPASSISSAIHALDLRLQSALLRTREAESLVNDVTPDSSKSLFDALVRTGLEIDAARAVWEDASIKASRVLDSSDSIDTFPGPDTPCAAPLSFVDPNDLPEIAAYEPRDEVFEDVVDQEESVTGALNDWPEAGAGKKKSEDMKRVLTELRPWLKERADLWEEREKRALGIDRDAEDEKRWGKSTDFKDEVATRELVFVESKCPDDQPDCIADIREVMEEKLKPDNDDLTSKLTRSTATTSTTNKKCPDRSKSPCDLLGPFPLSRAKSESGIDYSPGGTASSLAPVPLVSSSWKRSQEMLNISCGGAEFERRRNLIVDIDIGEKTKSLIPSHSFVSMDQETNSEPKNPLQVLDTPNSSPSLVTSTLEILSTDLSEERLVANEIDTLILLRDDEGESGIGIENRMPVPAPQKYIEEKDSCFKEDDMEEMANDDETQTVQLSHDFLLDDSTKAESPQANLVNAMVIKAEVKPLPGERCSLSANVSPLSRPMPATASPPMAGSYAFNKTIAHLAVAKSAEFRKKKVKVMCAPSEPTDETFGDPSSDEDSYLDGNELD